MPVFRVSLRTRILTGLARRFGVAFVIPSIAVRELADRDRYSDQDDAATAGLAKEERGHAAVMRAIGNHAGGPGEDASASGLGRAANVASNLRAAVLGANDGLASNFCLLMGVAAGGAPTSMILLSGVAGLCAGACAMALGEWLSVTNAREMATSQLDQQVEESGAIRLGELKELALIYEVKGMSEEQAKSTAETLISQNAAASDALSRAELEINPAHLGANPGSAAAVSFALFSLGAIVPLAPFFFLSARSGVTASIGLSLAALFALGWATSFFNGRSPMFSGLRQLSVGAAAATITYVVGRVFGAVVM
jgi:VIT1/CCC1 family predicted Fe2+/Mn2+ transporter